MARCQPLGAVSDARVARTASGSSGKAAAPVSSACRGGWSHEAHGTESAVLADRCMLPEIGAARLGMAALAGIVDRVTGKRRRHSIAVRRMAAGAVHLALEERVRECLHRLGCALPGGSRSRPRAASPSVQHLVGGRMAVGGSRHRRLRRCRDARPSCQPVPTSPLWQSRHIARSAGLATGRRAGAAEVRDRGPFLAAPDAARSASPPGPWQASHCSWPWPNGPRESDGTACLRLEDRERDLSSSWQDRQVSAPSRLYSASWPTAVSSNGGQESDHDYD